MAEQRCSSRGCQEAKRGRKRLETGNTIPWLTHDPLPPVRVCLLLAHSTVNSQVNE